MKIVDVTRVFPHVDIKFLLTNSHVLCNAKKTRFLCRIYSEDLVRGHIDGYGENAVQAGIHASLEFANATAQKGFVTSDAVARLFPRRDIDCGPDETVCYSIGEQGLIIDDPVSDVGYAEWNEGNGAA
jgi:hypothetical protein